MKKTIGRSIRLTMETSKRLDKYLADNYGEHNAVSLTVERAVREFLDRNNGSDLSQGIMPEIKR